MQHTATRALNSIALSTPRQGVLLHQCVLSASCGMLQCIVAYYCISASFLGVAVSVCSSALECIAER